MRWLQNRRLRESSKRYKLAMVAITINGEHLDPPGGVLDAELSCSRELYEAAHQFCKALAEDHQRIVESKQKRDCEDEH